MTKEKKKTAKRKTGNCWSERHHTCKGWGIFKSGESGRIKVYLCVCDCHEDKREQIAEVAKRWEGMQAVR